MDPDYTDHIIQVDFLKDHPLLQDKLLNKMV
jgi:hypothetical protein